MSCRFRDAGVALCSALEQLFFSRERAAGLLVLLWEPSLGFLTSFPTYVSQPSSIQDWLKSLPTWSKSHELLLVFNCGFNATNYNWL